MTHPATGVLVDMGRGLPTMPRSWQHFYARIDAAHELPALFDELLGVNAAHPRYEEHSALPEVKKARRVAFTLAMALYEESSARQKPFPTTGRLAASLQASGFMTASADAFAALPPAARRATHQAFESCRRRLLGLGEESYIAAYFEPTMAPFLLEGEAFVPPLDPDAVRPPRLFRPLRQASATGRMRMLFDATPKEAQQLVHHSESLVRVMKPFVASVPQPGREADLEVLDLLHAHHEMHFLLQQPEARRTVSQRVSALLQGWVGDGTAIPLWEHLTELAETFEAQAGFAQLAPLHPVGQQVRKWDFSVEKSCTIIGRQLDDAIAAVKAGNVDAAPRIWDVVADVEQVLKSLGSTTAREPLFWARLAYEHVRDDLSPSVSSISAAGSMGPRGLG